MTLPTELIPRRRRGGQRQACIYTGHPDRRDRPDRLPATNHPPAKNTEQFDRTDGASNISRQIYFRRFTLLRAAVVPGVEKRVGRNDR